MKRLVATSALLTLAAISARATTIYEDSFDGLVSAELNGTAPDTTTAAATWVAAPFFKADGSFATGNTGSATLAIAPEQGKIYTMDLSIDSISAGSWVAFGFANGQGTETGNLYRFTSENGNQVVEGRAWGLVRATGAAGNNRSFLSGSQGAGAVADWENIATQDAPLDVRVVLDTTGGDNNWTTTLYARAGADPYAVIRSESALGLNDDITSLGFATAGSGGSVSYFKLDVVPEPSSLALLGLGGLCVLRRRRG